MINILVADDHIVVRGGLNQFFATIDDINIGAEAASGAEVLDMLKPGNDFDLLLLDLTMPGIHGIDLITRIQCQDKSLPILVFSMHEELQVAKRVLQAGASGYVTKGSGQETLIGAIRKVASGGRFVDPILAEQMMFVKTGREEAPHSKLSERELQILKLIARGETLKRIAEKLFISNKTVSTHKTHVMKKLNIQSTAELVRYAVDNTLVD